MKLPRYKIKDEIARRVEILTELDKHAQKLGFIAQFLYKTINSGGRVFTAGNGGSAAEASHFAAELVGRYKIARTSIDARNLASDGATITAIGNDFGFDQVFAHQLSGQFKDEDVAIFFTTSGNSENILRALEMFPTRNTVVIGGRDGGKCKGKARVELTIESDDTAIIQESHLVLVHIICDLLERKLQQEPDSRFLTITP